MMLVALGPEPAIAEYERGVLLAVMGLPLTGLALPERGCVTLL